MKIIKSKPLAKWIQSLPMGEAYAIRDLLYDKISVKNLTKKFKEMNAPKPVLFAKIIGHNWKLKKS